MNLHNFNRGAASNRPQVPLTLDQLRTVENVIRGGLSARAPREANGRRGRMVTTRTVNGIDQDVRLNRALWQLAERMAELKGARSAA